MQIYGDNAKLRENVHVSLSSYTVVTLQQLRPFVDTTHTLVCAIILSRLDYCNILYTGCTVSTLHRLQGVQDPVDTL